MQSFKLVSLKSVRLEIVDRCTDCGQCRAQCDFLKTYGSPREIGEKIDTLPYEEWPDPFECALCGLCGGLCPEQLRPEDMFLAMRREMTDAGQVDLKRYGPVLTYEKLGASSLLSLLRLPAGGDTVLFPGCALPSSRSDTVRKLYLALRESLPNLGIALGCCFKPSYDLGRTDFFETRFAELHDALMQAGVKRLITACPNCQKVFSSHGGGMEIVTAYEILADSGYSPLSRSSFPAVVHDPCPQRYDDGVQDAVRVLSERCGVDILKRSKERRLTRCCGEGGMVKFVRPELTSAWTEDRKNMAEGANVVTSCAGCTNYLGGALEVSHVLDLLLGSKPNRLPVPPFTYVARFLLKQWFRRRLG